MLSLKKEHNELAYIEYADRPIPYMQESCFARMTFEIAKIVLKTLSHQVRENEEC